MVLLAAGILYFISSTVNPILYNVMSLRYRKAFRDTLHAALITAHCRQPDTPTLVAMDARHNWPLLRRNRSDATDSQTYRLCSQTTNRMVRSAESVRRWTVSHSQMRYAAGTQQTVMVTMCHTPSDEQPKTCHHSEH